MTVNWPLLLLVGLCLMGPIQVWRGLRLLRYVRVTKDSVSLLLTPGLLLRDALTTVIGLAHLILFRSGVLGGYVAVISGYALDFVKDYLMAIVRRRRVGRLNPAGEVLSQSHEERWSRVMAMGLRRLQIFDAVWYGVGYALAFLPFLIVHTDDVTLMVFFVFMLGGGIGGATSATRQWKLNQQYLRDALMKAGQAN